MRCSPSTVAYLAQLGDLQAARALRAAGFAPDLRPLAGTAAIEETRAASRRVGIRIDPCVFEDLSRAEAPVRLVRERKHARPWWPDGCPHPDARFGGAP
jgi:hypothetical protein